jgi:hypothetical protein
VRESKESDWKLLRQLNLETLERFCKQILSEIERINSDRAKDLHQEYPDIDDQLGGRETIWASSMIRNSPEQTFEVQMIDAPREYWAEVISPGDPHKGQASTATKLGAKDSRR